MENIKVNITETLKKFKKIANYFSYLRLASFLLFILFFVLCLGFYQNIYYMLMFLFLFIFIIFVVIHNRFYNKILDCEYELKVINDNISRKNLNFSHFSDKGIDFINEDKNYLTDLNILGENSLYQYITVAKTKLGRKKLFDLLDNKKIEDDFFDRQNIISELSNNKEFFILFVSKLYQYSDIPNKKNIDIALNDFKIVNKVKKHNIIIQIFIYILLFIFLILSIFNPINLKFLLLIFLFQFVYSSIYGLLNKNNNKNIIFSFSDYLDIIKVTKEFNFKNDKLNNIINSIKLENIKFLNNVKLLYDLKGNIFTYIIFNILFNLNIVADIIYIKYQKLSNMNDVIDKIAVLESYLSLSIVNMNFKSVKPILNNDITIKFKNIYYPLIKDPIKNDFETDNGCVIITGSNMSGKTSFLRTIGLNMILFKSGANVLADYFEASDFNIFTAINIKDEITKGISSFYKEILTVKKAIDYSDKKIVLIDEIFKGTNANDRITGAKSLIKKLKCDNVILIITTHDFELCDISDIKNYHFSEYYIEDKINFDYKIKNGKCLTTNAIYLLKMAKIIE